MSRSRHLARRTTLAILAAAPFGLAPRTVSAASAADVHQAEALAAAEFTDGIDNIPHRLGELTRPLLLVNLWASWCSGCLAEVPSLLALPNRLARDSIDVLLISHEMNWSADLTYAQRAQLPFPHWRLSARSSKSIATTAFRVEDDRFALPQSLLFAGRQRVLAEATQGSRDWAAPERVRWMQRWLDTIR